MFQRVHPASWFRKFRVQDSVFRFSGLGFEHAAAGHRPAPCPVLHRLILVERAANVAMRDADPFARSFYQLALEILVATNSETRSS